jgi:arginyl-tRNA synthetase
MYLKQKAFAEVRDAVAEALEELSIEEAGPVIVAEPREKRFGNAATSIAFHLAKVLRKEPRGVAENLALVLKKKKIPFVENVEPVAGYVNFFFSQKFFEQAAEEAAGKKDFGKNTLGKGKKVVVEYSSPNVGKPFHIGHIRSTILGDSVKRVLAFSGYKTIGFNYPSDTGAQVAKLVLAMKELKHLPKVGNERDLLQYYIQIHRKIEENPALKQEADAILQKIEAGDKKALREVAKIVKVSWKAVEKNYALLGVKFDETRGESAFIAPAKKMVAEALEKKIGRKDATGAIVAELEPTLPNTLLARSNGTTLYLARDLALADYKHKKYGFDLSIYVTGSEQSLHFKQVFYILEKIGRKWARNCLHVPFGLVFLQGEKLSSREGKVIFLEDVLNEAVEKALEEIKKASEYGKGEVKQIAEKVGIGSTKFAFLRVTPEKSISFNPAQAVSFEGDTGAYVQYTFVRAANILRKEKEEKNKSGRKIKTKKDANSIELTSQEKNLASALSDFPLVVESAAKQFRPHVVCEYLLELAKLFSEFYENCPVLKAEGSQKKFRLRLVKGTKNVLQNGLALLGIEAPERM